ncbi:hypothetical protein GCM10028796_23150 [Ramlibacter monticola]|uniref:Uncharacterized protein n=1 Tax=Ramlibacter monticola TaxID=1926872 RepID=A0A937CTH2_9BURK|nr:hypothetical protein [Ramlibacter monticola]MBL0392565.1 hypothetical protein [Ramlibacter monticola]
MQSHYPEQFERDMACTEAEWLGWLPRAIGPLAWEPEPGSARVRIGSGRLRISWHEAPPRRIALLELACLHVAFSFENVDDGMRYAFMKRFDLYMLRGGG